MLCQLILNAQVIKQSSLNQGVALKTLRLDKLLGLFLGLLIQYCYELSVIVVYPTRISIRLLYSDKQILLLQGFLLDHLIYLIADRRLIQFLNWIIIRLFPVVQSLIIVPQLFILIRFQVASLAHQKIYEWVIRIHLKDLVQVFLGDGAVFEFDQTLAQSKQIFQLQRLVRY